MSTAIAVTLRAASACTSSRLLERVEEADERRPFAQLGDLRERRRVDLHDDVGLGENSASRDGSMVAPAVL